MKAGFLGVLPVGQQVKDLTAVAQVAAEAWVQSLAWHGVCLRIWLCCSYVVGHSCGLDSIPGPGTSMCHRCSQLKKKKKKELKLNCLVEKT